MSFIESTQLQKIPVMRIKLSEHFEMLHLICALQPQIPKIKLTQFSFMTKKERDNKQPYRIDIFC